MKQGEMRIITAGRGVGKSMYNEYLKTLEEEMATIDNEKAGIMEELRLTQRELAIREGDVLKMQIDINELATSLASMPTVVAAVDADAEKDMLISEMNALMEAKMEAEARVSAAEADMRQYRDQLSEYDRTSAREQEEIMRVAEDEMNQLRSQLTHVSEALVKTQLSEKRLQETCSVLHADVATKDDALAETQNELFQIRQEAECSESAQKAIETITGERNSAVFRLQKAQEQSDISVGALTKLQEEIARKDSRIAHLETTKLTQDQLEKIKLVKEERKKLSEDNKVMKKQLLQLKKAYDDLKASAFETAAAAAAAATTTSGGGALKNVASIAEIAELKVQVGEFSVQIENYQSMNKTLKDKLRECSTQLQEYETERGAVVSVLEIHGIDTLGLLGQDTSVSDDASASVLEQDLADAVSKLAQKLSERHAAATHSHLQQSTSAMEERARRLQTEIDEAKAQRSAFEKRLEGMNATARASREEIATLSADADILRIRVEELQRELGASERKVIASVDNASSEVQALEEENIQLMKENREQRKEAAFFKAQLERIQGQGAAKQGSSGGGGGALASVESSSSSSSKSTGTIEKENVSLSMHNSEMGSDKEKDKGQKRSLGVDGLSKPSSSSSSTTTLPAVVATSTVDDISKAKRAHKKAKALVTTSAAEGLAAAGDAPGDCAQS